MQKTGLRIWMPAKYQNIVFNSSSLSVDEDVPFACDHIAIEMEPEIRWQLNEDKDFFSIKLCPLILSQEF